MSGELAWRCFQEAAAAAERESLPGCSCPWLRHAMLNLHYNDFSVTSPWQVLSESYGLVTGLSLLEQTVSTFQDGPDAVTSS